MKRKRVLVFSVTAVILVVAIGMGSLLFYQNHRMQQALSAMDSAEVQAILEEPFAVVHQEWMEQAVANYDTASIMPLYEAGAELPASSWLYVADLMPFSEFQAMVDAGAPLDAEYDGVLLLEGLYGINDEPEKWQLAHETLGKTYVNEHPELLVRAAENGNTEAFEWILQALDANRVPYEDVVPVVLEMNQQLMLDALQANGYTVTAADAAYAKEVGSTLL